MWQFACPQLSLPCPMLSQPQLVVADMKLTSQFLLPEPRKGKTLVFPLKRDSMTSRNGVYFSPTMKFGPTNWCATASFDKTVKSYPTRWQLTLNVEVFCNKTSTNPFWNCEALISATIKNVPRGQGATFSSTSKSLIVKFESFYETEEEMLAMINDETLTLKIEIIIISYKSMMDFSEYDPHLTQCALLVEGHKLHINKYLLAERSPYFYTIFFLESGNKDKTEIEMKDVVYKEFIEFLNICYSNPVDITAQNFGYLLKLGYRFKHSVVMEHCRDFLESADDMNVIDKLQYAHDYGLRNIQKNCLNELRTEESILDACSNYGKITPEVAHILFEMLMNPMLLQSRQSIFYGMK